MNSPESGIRLAHGALRPLGGAARIAAEGINAADFPGQYRVAESQLVDPRVMGIGLLDTPGAAQDCRGVGMQVHPGVLFGLGEKRDLLEDHFGGIVPAVRGGEEQESLFPVEITAGLLRQEIPGLEAVGDVAGADSRIGDQLREFAPLGLRCGVDRLPAAFDPLVAKFSRDLAGLEHGEQSIEARCAAFVRGQFLQANPTTWW